MQMATSTTNAMDDPMFGTMSPKIDHSEQLVSSTPIPLLSMMIDRTSFDETDDFGVNQHVKANAESYVAAPPVIMKDGKVRRRLRWRPKGMAKRRRAPTSPQQSTSAPIPSPTANSNTMPLKISNSSHNKNKLHSSQSSNCSVISQASKQSKKSLHSFASVETACINNTATRKTSVGKFPTSRLSQYNSQQYHQNEPIGAVSTIGNEGDFVQARIYRNQHGNIKKSSFSSDPNTKSSATIFAAADTSNDVRTLQPSSSLPKVSFDNKAKIRKSPSATDSAASDRLAEAKPISNVEIVATGNQQNKIVEPSVDESGPISLTSQRRIGLPPRFQRRPQVQTLLPSSSFNKNMAKESPNSTSSTSTGSVSDSNSSLDSSIDSDTGNCQGLVLSHSPSLIPVPSLSGDEIEAERRVDLRIRRSSSNTSNPADRSPVNNDAYNSIETVASLDESLDPLTIHDLLYEENQDSNIIVRHANERQSVRINDTQDRQLPENLNPMVELSSFVHPRMSSIPSQSHDQNEIRFSMSNHSEPSSFTLNTSGSKTSLSSKGAKGIATNDVKATNKVTPSKIRTCPVDVDNGTFLEAEKNLQAIHEMASEHLRQGECSEALEVFEEILRGQLARFGEDHYRVGTALHNIGIVHMRRGDYARALSLYKEAVRIRKKALDPYHPDVASSLAQLGVAYMERGKHRKAIGAFREALKIRRKCLGNDHPKVAKILNNIGCSLFELNELEVAMVAFEEALDIQRNLLRCPLNSRPISESSLLSIASTQSNIASIKLYCGQFDEATVDLEEALLIQQCALGDDHPLARRTQESIRWMEMTRLSSETEPVTVDLMTQLTGDSMSSNVTPKNHTEKRVLTSNIFDSLFARLDLACGGKGWDTNEKDDASYGETVSDKSSL